MKQTIIIALFLAMATSLTAQDRYTPTAGADPGPFSFNFSTGASFASGTLGDADAGTGFGFEGSFAYRFMPHLAAYAGWGWTKFPVEVSFAGAEMDFEETGYTFGLQFVHPLGVSTLSYVIKAGGIYNHIEIENTKGDITADSKHGLGWRVEGGIDIPLSGRVHLNPAVRYSSLSRPITAGGGTTAVYLRYVSAAVGVTWTF